MQAAGISQLPVLQDGKPVGSIQEVTLARMLHDHSDPAQVTVGEVMARPLPQLDVDVHLDEAYRLLLAGNTGVLATAGRQGGRHRHAHRPDPVLESTRARPEHGRARPARWLIQEDMRPR